MPGDMISIGKYRLHFAVGADPEEAGMGLDQGDAKGSASADQNRPSGAVETHAKADSELARQLATGEIAAALMVKRGKQKAQVFLVGADDVIIGRHGCQVRLHDISVGRNHAVIRLQEDHFLLRDLGSWNGTIVNGEKVRERRLANGDEIIIGSTILEFRLGPAADIKELKSASDRRRRVALATSDMVDVHQLSTEALPDRIPATAASPPMPPPSSDELDQDIDSIRLSPDVSGEVPDSTPTPHQEAEDEDDEFAPMTEEELAALEEDADDAFGHLNEEDIRRAEWEQIEAERMMHEGGGMAANRPGSLLDSPDEEESAHIRAPGPGEEPEPIEDEDEAEELVRLEEQALFRGPVTDVDASASPTPDDSVSVTPEALARNAPGRVATAPQTTRESGEQVAVPDGVDPKEYKRWMRGLKNRSKVVRREAARKLKELTGNDYDWESDPE